MYRDFDFVFNVYYLAAEYFYSLLWKNFKTQVLTVDKKWLYHKWDCLGVFCVQLWDSLKDTFIWSWKVFSVFNSFSWKMHIASARSLSL